MTLLLLGLAGFGAGFTGSVAGLASLVSYPALLAAGLPPVIANTTNTVALTGSTIGTAVGSLLELKGQGPQLLRLSTIFVVGGAAGGVLLLVTPSRAFEVAVPWLIALASILLIASPRIRVRLENRRSAKGTQTQEGQLVFSSGVFAFIIAVYGGYFGAASGVMLLALLSTVWDQSLARNNAAKNIANGAANLVAAVIFVVSGSVDWLAAVAVGAGALIGARIGPMFVRRVPATPLRIAIGLAGIGLAISQWVSL